MTRGFLFRPFVRGASLFSSLAVSIIEWKRWPSISISTETLGSINFSNDPTSVDTVRWDRQSQREARRGQEGPLGLTGAEAPWAPCQSPKTRKSACQINHGWPIHQEAFLAEEDLRCCRRRRDSVMFFFFFFPFYFRYLAVLASLPTWLDKLSNCSKFYDWNYKLW